MGDLRKIPVRTPCHAERLFFRIRENRVAEASFAERYPVFASKPPSRMRKSGPYKEIAFTGRGFGGWVAGKISLQHTLPSCV